MENTRARAEHLPFCNSGPSNMENTSVHSHMLRYVFIPALCIYQLNASFKEVCPLWLVGTTLISTCDNSQYSKKDINLKTLVWDKKH
jgi:hypothetical protein